MGLSSGRTCPRCGLGRSFVMRFVIDRHLALLSYCPVWIQGSQQGYGRIAQGVAKLPQSQQPRTWRARRTQACYYPFRIWDRSPRPMAQQGEAESRVEAHCETSCEPARALVGRAADATTRQHSARHELNHRVRFARYATRFVYHGQISVLTTCVEPISGAVSSSCRQYAHRV